MAEEAKEPGATLQAMIEAQMSLAIKNQVSAEARRDDIANSHIQAQNLVQQAVSAKAASLLLGLGAKDAAAINDLQTSDVVAEKVASLVAAIAAGKQVSSTADRTPVVNTPE